MKNTFKKMAALLMAVAMVITSMSITAFAAKDPSVTVKGVDSGKVTLYQIVEEGNGGWQAVTGVTLADPTNPTGEEVQALAADTSSLTAVDPVKTADGSPLTWTGLEPGIYMAVVTETAKEDLYIYSPMIVSVDYTDGGNEVDAAGSSNFSDVATAKKYKPTVTKEIVDFHNDDFMKANVKGDGTNKGDIVTYKVTADIPAYSKDYVDPEYFFSDTLGDSFAGYVEGSLTVTETGKTPQYHFVTDMTATGKTFKIQFDDVTPGDAARTVVLQYQAKISETAFNSGFDPNTNTAKIEYSHDPSDVSKHTTQEDETHHYTFNIDGELNGLEGEKDKWTDEIIKVGKDGKPFPGAVPSKTEYESDVKYKNAELAEAKFGIWKKGEENGEPLQVVVTGTNGPTAGRMEFRGLDVGEYTIKEIEAPKGYQKINAEIPVEISATVDSKGRLTSYSIKINGNDSTYTCNYEGGVKVIERAGSSQTTFVKNDEQGSLPSTGGMGTVIFTIAGIAIMAIAAGLFIANKKASK